MKFNFRPILSLMLLLTVVPALAQNETIIPVHFAGRIQRGGSGTTIVVNDIPIDIQSAAVSASLDVGSVVVIDGILLGDGTVVAQFLSPQTAPLAAPPPTAPPPTLVSPQNGEAVILSGEIEAVVGNQVTVVGQTVMIPENDPALHHLQVGDQIRITERIVAGYAVAVSVVRAHDRFETEGVVQEIDDTAVTVDGQRFELKPHDLRDIQPGDTIHIEGRYVESPAGLVVEVTKATVSSDDSKIRSSGDRAGISSRSGSS